MDALITDLTDDEIRTVWPDTPRASTQADDDATDPGGDPDTTDADGTDGGDADGTDADGTDADDDASDSDADGTDA